MQISCKIIDKTNCKISQIIVPNSLIFDNTDNADIQITSDENYIIKFSKFFILLKNDINFDCSFLQNKLEIDNFNYDFQIENTELNFYNLEINFNLITEIFNNDIFKQIIYNIQLEEANNLNINIENKNLYVIKRSSLLLCQYINDNNNFLEIFDEFIWCIWSQICKYGIITKLIENVNISEIMINNYDKIYIENNGLLSLSNLKFSDKQNLMNIIERIVSEAGRRIDESKPYCDTRLIDGSRVNAIIPPLAIDGPCLTIRKFQQQKLNAHNLIKYNSISKEMLEFLQNIVYNRKNILISGGTGTGKTTLLNILSSFISDHERIITIEDSAELQLLQPHVVRLESRIANMEGKGEISLRDLIKNALRMRPDRIIVGECRGSEALDMLQAMNTGHDGSMTTTHANNPVSALRRVETLVMFAATHLPSLAIREQIVSGIEYVVQLKRFDDGARRIISLHKVLELDEQTHKFRTKAIYEYTGEKGEWLCCL